MTNSADPYELASSAGSTLFAETGHVVISKRKVKYRQSECCGSANQIFSIIFAISC